MSRPARAAACRCHRTRSLYQTIVAALLLGHALGAVAGYTAARREVCKEKTAQWRDGYMRGYRVGRQAVTYEPMEMM